MLGGPDQGPHTGLGDGRAPGCLTLRPGAEMVPSHRVTVAILHGARHNICILFKGLGLKSSLGKVKILKSMNSKISISIL